MDINDDRGKNVDAVGDTETDAEFTIGSVTDFDAESDPGKYVFSNDVAESDTCTDPESCSDIVFEGDIDDSPKCARDNGADGDANMDAVDTNGIDDSFDTDTDGVFDNSTEGKTIIDFNEESDADDDTDRDSGFDSKTEGRFAGFRADDKTIRNVSDRDTDNECETDVDVVFDNDIEGTACFETDADSDRGAVCITDDRDADIDFVCGNKLDGDTVSDCNVGNDTNDNTVRDDGLVIATDAEYSDKDFVGDNDTDDDRDTGTDGAADSGAERNIDTDASGDTNKVVDDNSALGSTTDKEKRSCCFDLDTESDTGTDVVLDNFADGNTDSGLDVDSDIDVDSDNDNDSELVRDNNANSDTDKDAVDADTDADFTTNFVAEFVTNSDTDEDFCSDTDADRVADCDSDTSDGRVGDTDK